MKAYSEDLRRKIVDALKRGMPKSETATLFGVSLSSVKRFAKMDRQGDSLAPRKPPGRPPKSNDAIRRPLSEDLTDRPTQGLHPPEGGSSSQPARRLPHLARLLDEPKANLAGHLRAGGRLAQADV